MRRSAGRSRPVRMRRAVGASPASAAPSDSGRLGVGCVGLGLVGPAEVARHLLEGRHRRLVVGVVDAVGDGCTQLLRRATSASSWAARPASVERRDAVGEDDPAALGEGHEDLRDAPRAAALAGGRRARRRSRRGRVTVAGRSWYRRSPWWPWWSRWPGCVPVGDRCSWPWCSGWSWPACSAMLALRLRRMLGVLAGLCGLGMSIRMPFGERAPRTESGAEPACEPWTVAEGRPEAGPVSGPEPAADAAEPGAHAAVALAGWKCGLDRRRPICGPSASVCRIRHSPRERSRSVKASRIFSRSPCSMTPNQ